MIRKLLLAVAALATLSTELHAQASYTALDSTGATVTFKSITCGGQICPLSVPADLTGAAFGVTGNPFFVAPASGATFPVSGTFWQTTQPVSAASLPLPALAATSTKQSDGSQKTQIVDGSGNVIASTSNALNVNITSGGITGFALDTTVQTTNTNLGAPGATACTTDTASCNLNQQMQRNNQRLTTINTTLGTPFQAGGSIGNTTFAATQSGAWSLSANQSVNVAQINGVTPLMGNGVTGTGSQRVTIASDNTAFSVNATLQASASTAIGKVDPNTPATWGLVAVGGAAAPTNGLVGGAVYNSSPITVTNTQAAALQADVNGYIKVNVQSAVGLAQGSTTSGQTGSMVMAAVTTANPSYTTAQTSPLSLDLNGGLRIGGEGSAGSAAGGVMTIQGVASMTPVAGNITQVLGAAISATNGLYANVLQGNAVLSLTNPSFTKITDGTTAAKVEPASTPAAVTDAALAVAPIPSELHVGETGSNQIKVQVAQTVTASAYSAGNALGGLMTIANAARVSGSAGNSGTGGIVTGMQLNSKAIQSAVQVDVFFFDANPTGSTCTDKSAFVISNADFDKVVGIMTIPSTPANGAGWFGATTTGSVAIPTYFPVTYDLASATSIYACAVVRAAITPGSTSDISFKFNILRN